MAERALSPSQHLAAQMLGEGRTQNEVADECGTTTTSVRRWGKRADFQELVKSHRERRLDANPSAREICEQALTATARDGKPAWNTRLLAAKLLMQESGDVPADTPPRAERIFLDPED